MRQQRRRCYYTSHPDLLTTLNYDSAAALHSAFCPALSAMMEWDLLMSLSLIREHFCHIAFRWALTETPIDFPELQTQQTKGNKKESNHFFQTGSRLTLTWLSSHKTFPPHTFSISVGFKGRETFSRGEIRGHVFSNARRFAVSASSSQPGNISVAWGRIFLSRIWHFVTSVVKNICAVKRESHHKAGNVELSFKMCHCFRFCLNGECTKYVSHSFAGVFYIWCDKELSL